MDHLVRTLLNASGGEHSSDARMHGVFTGEVVDVSDPDNRPRVKVRLYAFDGPESQSAEFWARVAVGVAGNDRGTYMIPDVGDEVVVMFEGGRPEHAIVIGSLWNGNNSPPDAIGDGVDRWTFKGKDGTTITVNEATSGQAKVKVETPMGVTAELTDAGGGKIELQASGSTVTIDAGGVTVDTSGQVSVTGSTMSFSAGTANFDVPLVSFSGIITCTTIQATTVVGTTYTPGAGNIW
ncbi:MAG: phage baseplate assembly protein V [Alphaproteobacteria bacterium]|nr:phage baseplate assembly protein V [Alphaproteobacteria bacterium]MCB9791547.1 phage baseplate assembly protein V [Alphaproteobacteria bacterium]